MNDTSEPNDWDRLPTETDEEYVLFARYYLALGLRRSYRGAYLQYLRENNPTKLLAQLVQGAPSDWTQMAKRNRWEERAEAYDKETLSEALKAVEEAAKQIRLAAPDAVSALIRELASPRNSVMAANSILDRAGVATSQITRSVELTSDELAKAREELDEWNQKNNPKSSG